MNPKLTQEETRVLRREVRGFGNLERLGLIEVTPKGRQFIAQDDERILYAKARAGAVGGTARAASMSPLQRRELGRKGGKASGRKRARSSSNSAGTGLISRQR